MVNCNYNATEDFSFPVISNNPLTNFMVSSTSSSSSSSLWRIKSKVYHHYSEDEYEDEQEEEEDHRMEIRSMCDEILPSRRDDLLEGLSFRRENSRNMEESMDFLWQNFNEEEEEEEEMCTDLRNSNKQISCVMQRSKMSRKPTRLFVIGKMLKGLVSIRKSAKLKASKPRF